MRDLKVKLRKQRLVRVQRSKKHTYEVEERVKKRCEDRIGLQTHTHTDTHSLNRHCTVLL